MASYFVLSIFGVYSGIPYWVVCFLRLSETEEIIWVLNESLR